MDIDYAKTLDTLKTYPGQEGLSYVAVKPVKTPEELTASGSFQESLMMI